MAFQRSAFRQSTAGNDVHFCFFIRTKFIRTSKGRAQKKRKKKLVEFSTKRLPPPPPPPSEIHHQVEVCIQYVGFDSGF